MRIHCDMLVAGIAFLYNAAYDERWVARSVGFVVSNFKVFAPEPCIIRWNSKRRNNQRSMHDETVYAAKS